MTVVNSGNEESALQDVAAWRAIGLLYAKNYSKWTEIDLKTYLVSLSGVIPTKSAKHTI